MVTISTAQSKDRMQEEIHSGIFNNGVAVNELAVLPGLTQHGSMQRNPPHYCVHIENEPTLLQYIIVI